MIYKSEKSYVDMIKPIAREVGLKYNYLPSVLAAQPIQETGYGGFVDHTTESMIDNNNHLGMKSDLINDTWAGHSVWPGKSFKKLTPEWEGGQMIKKYDYFRIYDSIKQCLEDYCLFMTWAKRDNGTYKYRNDVIGNSDPASTIKAVRINGYCTDPTYDKSILNIIDKWGLRELDEGFGKKKTVKIGDRSIIDITARNKGQVPASRGSNPIQFIVVHYLGVPNADNPDLYGGGYGGHYNIKRDGTIYRAADPKTAVVWQCGGGRQGSGGGSFFKVCTNYNSIGIENGVCYTESGVKDPPDDSDKWYFTEETQESLVWLVSKLMDRYNISFDHVIRHYDVTGKICPNPYVRNNHTRTSWTWDEFKANLKQYRKDGTITVPDGSAPTPTKDYITIGDKGEAVKEMQEMLIACGYSCGGSGADGIFGQQTSAALKSFKHDYGMLTNDHYGEKTAEKLKAVYKEITKSFTTKFLASCQNVVDTARKSGWKYGDSQKMPPCSDGLISCDRLVARVLYNMGYTDQRTGGEVCGTLPDWLPAHGWKKILKKKNIKPGAVIAVRRTSHDWIDHVFVVKTYDVNTDRCDKYDTGSDERIRTVQPFKNVPLVEWSDRVFVCAWNPPSDASGDGSGTTWNGVNYKAVYNYTYYRKKYADLRKAFGTEKKKYFEHFCQYGMKEARQASANFNVKAYKARYQDLRKAFGDNLPEYYKHYCLFGKKEGRNGK